ncbi:hypothetical protein [Ramlibacter sp.]|nr:hypothetical protein [Ramlibacter sp.]
MSELSDAAIADPPLCAAPRRGAMRLHALQPCVVEVQFEDDAD